MADKVATLVVELRGSFAKFQADMNSVSRSIAKTGASLQSIGSKMTTAFSAPLAGIGVAALKMGMDFDKSMNTIQARGNFGAQAMESMRASAMKLGADTIFSAKQAAEGMSELAAAGHSSAQILAEMPGVLNMAAAGQLSVADASALAVSAMSQFNIEAKNSGHVADVLSTGADAGVLSMADLGESLKYAGGVAHTAGMSLEETTAALAVMSNAGIKASTAGTGLAHGIGLLAAPTRKGAAELVKLNIATKDSGGNLRDFAGLMEEIGAKTANMGTANKVSFFKKVFGEEAFKAFIPLAEAAKGQITSLADAFVKSSDDGGAALRKQAILMQGLPGAWERFTGSINTAGIAISDALKPTIIDLLGTLDGLADKLAGAATWFETLNPSVKGITIAIAGIAVVAGPAIIVIGSLIAAFSAIISPLALTTAAIIGAGVAIGAFLATNETTNGAITAIWGSIVSVFNDVVAGVASAMQGVMAAIAPVIEWFKSNAPLMGLVWQQVWTDIQAIYTTFIQPIFTAIGEGFASAFALLKADLATLAPVFSAVWSGISATVQSALSVIGDVMTTAMQLYTGTFPASFEQMKTAVIASVTALYTGVKTYLLDKMTAIFDAVGAKVGEVAGYFRSLLTDVIKGSYVPELAAGVATHMTAINASLETTKASTENVSMAFYGFAEKAKKGLGDADKEAKKFQKSMTEMSLAITDVFDDLGQKTDELQTKLAGFIVAKDQAGMQSFIQEYATSAEKIKEVKDALGEAKTEAVGMAASQAQLATSLAATKTQLYEMATGIKVIDPLADSVTRLMQAGDVEGLNKLAENMYTSEEGAKQFDAALQEAKGSMDALAASGAKMAGTISGGVESILGSFGAKGDWVSTLGDLVGGMATGQGGGTGGTAGNWLNSLMSSSGGTGGGGGGWMDAVAGMFSSGGGGTSGIGPVASGAQYSGMLGGASGGGDFETLFSQGGGTGGGNMGAYAGAAAVVPELVKVFQTDYGFGKKAQGQQMKDSFHTVGMAVANAWTFGLASVAEGIIGRENLEKFTIGSHVIDALFGENAQTAARKGFDRWIEGALKESHPTFFNKEGKQENFDGNFETQKYTEGFSKPGWADDFQKTESFGTFNAIGIGLQKLSGITEDIGGQIGFILSTELNGNLDNARILMQSLGVSQQQMEDQFISMGESAEMSWHEVEVNLQGISAAFGEGLVAVGDFAGGFQQIVDSGGDGKDAIIAVQNAAIEAAEAGISSFADWRAQLIAAGKDVGMVDAMFAGFAQRGITSFEGIKEATTRTLGGVIADMQSASPALAALWVAAQAEAQAYLETVAKIPENSVKNVELNVTANVSPEAKQVLDGSIPSSQPEQKYATGGVVQGRTHFASSSGMGLMGEAGPEAILPLTRVNGKLGVATASQDGGGGGRTIIINAQGAEAGVENKIRLMLNDLHTTIIEDVFENLADSRGRGGRFSEL